LFPVQLNFFMRACKSSVCSYFIF